MSILLEKEGLREYSNLDTYNGLLTRFLILVLFTAFLANPFTTSSSRQRTVVEVGSNEDTLVGEHHVVGQRTEKSFDQNTKSIIVLTKKLNEMVHSFP